LALKAKEQAEKAKAEAERQRILAMEANSRKGT